MKSKIKYIILGLFIIMILTSIPIYFYFIKPYTWGEEGSLVLKISTNSDVIKYNQSLNINYTLINSGNSKIRILDFMGFDISIYDSNNNKIKLVEYLLDYPRPPNNNNLITLNKHQSYVTHDHIMIDNSWEYHSNITLKIIGSYKSINHDTISYPYWKGNLTSNVLFVLTT